MAEVLYQPFPMPGPAPAFVWRYTPENRRPRHFHLEPELNLIASGSGQFGMGDKVLSVVAGDLVWWPPGQDHELLDASPDFDLFVIGVTPAFSARVLGDDENAAYHGPTRLRLPPDVLAQLQTSCLVPLAAQDRSVVERQVGDLWQLAHARRRSLSDRSDRHTFTRRALVSLLDQPDLGRDDVAAIVRGHPTEVSRHFRRDMGLTLTAYRTRLRLMRFIHAADDGATNLLSAALAAGFGSYSQCHRAFQQTLGCAPRVFFGTDLRGQMNDTFSPWTR